MARLRAIFRARTLIMSPKAHYSLLLITLGAEAPLTTQDSNVLTLMVGLPIKVNLAHFLPLSLSHPISLPEQHPSLPLPNFTLIRLFFKLPA